MLVGAPPPPLVTTLSGLTTSHDPPLLVLAWTVKVAATLLVRLNVCGCGNGVPVWNAKLNCAGLTLKEGAPPNVTFTETCKTLPPPPGVSVIVPVDAPGFSCDGSTSTSRLTGWPGATELLMGLTDRKLG